MHFSKGQSDAGPACGPGHRYYADRVRPTLRSLAGLCVIAAATLFGCGGSPQPPNVLLITVDTLRADHLRPYGYEAIDTPAIARLAREGIVFEKAFADTSWTLPSLSSVMTGKYPSEHRVRTWQHSLGDEQETLAELLRDQGYSTAAVVGSYPLDRFFGLAQGFDHYDDEMTAPLFPSSSAGVAPPVERTDRPADASAGARARWQLSRSLNDGYRPDAEVADRAIEWLSQETGAPFLLWVHFFGPHEKGGHDGATRAERKAWEAAQIAGYDPAIEAMDREVGRLLAALGADPRGANTTVVFHSDHGQSLNEHGTFGHGMVLYDTNVHIPLIVRLPDGARAGERVPHLVRNLDIFTTILRLAGAPHAASTSRDLLAEAPAPDNHVYLETHHPMFLTTRKVEVDGRQRAVGRVLRGIRTDARKLITRQPYLAAAKDGYDPLPEDYVSENTVRLGFDVERDPQERRRIREADMAQMAELERQLGQHDDGAGGKGAPRKDLDDETRERLRSLGYTL